MVLVDTSVLISFFKNDPIEEVARLDFIIEHNIPFGITHLIYQEVLQGARTEKEFTILKDYLSTQTFYHLLYGKESYEKASGIYLKCRKKGITVRSTIDLLIVETVLENDLQLLHNDNDFKNIKKVIPELAFY